MNKCHRNKGRRKGEVREVFWEVICAVLNTVLINLIQNAEYTARQNMFLPGRDQQGRNQKTLWGLAL